MSIQSVSEPEPERNSSQNPEIESYESRPGKTVFIEAENTDGWIASDLTVDVVQ